MHSLEYIRAINSPHWGELKRQIRAQHRDRCQTCLKSGPLQLHHLHYDTLGNESEIDVELLCESCHETADEEREAATEQRQYEARLNGWANKVYGEGWEFREDCGSVEEEFDEFLERKGEGVC